MVSLETGERLADLLKRWRWDPVAFIEDCGLGTVYEPQRRIAEAVARHRLTLVCTGNMVGKDWIAARLVLWYWITHPPCTVITTGPRVEQLQEILWAEIRQAYHSSKIPLGGRLLPRAMRLHHGDRWKVLGTVSNDVAKLSGFHNEHVMVVIDEATGVGQAEFEAFLSLAPSPHDRILVLFNPTTRNCYAYHLWCNAIAERLTIPSTASPNFDGRPPSQYVHGLATPEWVDEIRQIYGEDSNYYRVHVRGVWPLSDHDETIPVDWLDAALQREPPPLPQPGDPHWTPRYMGVDLAEGVGGDASVIVVRDENAVLDIWRSRRSRASQVIEVANELADRYGVPDDRIFIDIVSSYEVYRYWRDQGRAVMPFQGGERAWDSRRFVNRRTESYWRFRDRLRPEHPHPFSMGGLPHDVKSMLRAELMALRHTVQSDRRIALERKSAIKHKLGRSPDIADALAMTFSHPMRARISFRRMRGL